MATYRAVILGCAPRSEWHARAYGLVEDADLVACCDAVDNLRHTFACRYGLREYVGLEEMVEKEKPDLIHVVTRPSTRVEQLTLISDMGVPACLVEKPIATGASDWRALADLVQRTETKIGVGAQWRYSPHMARCRSALRSGDLGAPLFMEATAGSTVCDQGVHVLDWAMSLNDEARVTRVFGTVSGAGELGTKHPSPDNAEGLLVFANGLGCSMVLGEIAPRVGTTYEAIGKYSHCRVAVYCEEGRVLFEEFGKCEIVRHDCKQSNQHESQDDWRRANDEAQAELTGAMLRWLADDSAPAGTELTRALHQWHAILGIYMSAVTHRPVELPFEPPDDLFDRMSRLVGQDS